MNDNGTDESVRESVEDYNRFIDTVSSQNDDSNGENLIINTTQPVKKTINKPHYKSLYEEQKKDKRFWLVIAVVGWLSFFIVMFDLIGRSL